MIIKLISNPKLIKYSNEMFWWKLPENIKGIILEKSNLVIPPYIRDLSDYVLNYEQPHNPRIMKILKKQNPEFKTLLDHSELYLYSNKISEKTDHQILDIDYDSAHFSTIKPVKAVWYFDLN